MNRCLLACAVLALSFGVLSEETHDEVPLASVTALDQSPNQEWLFAKPGDLRFADGISFDFRVDDPTAFDMFKISFRTGKGRYHGVFPATTRKGISDVAGTRARRSLGAAATTR